MTAKLFLFLVLRMFDNDLDFLLALGGVIVVLLVNRKNESRRSLVLVLDLNGKDVVDGQVAAALTLIRIVRLAFSICGRGHLFVVVVVGVIF